MRKTLLRWFGRGYSDNDARAEIEFHLAMRTEQNEAKGMAAEEARNEARRQFGNLTRIREDVRRVYVREWMEGVVQDARYALRGFRRSPAFALAAILAIAIGSGSATAVFSVVDRILFRSLPYADEGRLVWLGMSAPIGNQEFLLGPDYLEWRDAETPFEALTSSSGTADCDLSEDQPARLRCSQVEATFLTTFRMKPFLGRDFTRDDDRPRSRKVAILSHALWRSRFGGDPGVVGRSISLDGSMTEVVGILGPDFELPNLAHMDLLVPQRLDEAVQRARDRMAMLAVFGRLKPGVTVPQAAAALQPFFDRAMQFVPSAFRNEVKLRVYSLRDRQVREAKTASLVLLGAVLLVLLIAWANVANLLLARAASRQRESAIRAAIGAGQGRLMRQSLTEAAVLSLAGSLAGLLLAGLLLRAFVLLAPEGIPRLQQAGLDGRVLLISIAGSLGCGLLFGLAPALRGANLEWLTGVRVAGSRRAVLRPLLVTGQLAVSLVLLTGAGLLLQSLWHMQNVPLGIQADHVLTAEATLNRNRYPTPQSRIAFLKALHERLARLPGTTAVGMANSLPPAGRAMATIYSRIAIEGRAPVSDRGTGGMVVVRTVSPGYFGALGIPVRQGRGFTEEDRRSAGPVVILSESLARRMFPAGDSIGRRISPGRATGGPGTERIPWLTIVGVAADVKNAGLNGRDDPEYYELLRATPEDVSASALIVVRSAAGPMVLAPLVRGAVRNLDAALPVEIGTMTDRVSRLSQRPRFETALLGLFAGLGVLLAALGLYGVISFLVAQRVREIGVRLALGASRGRIVGMVLGQAARWTAAGTVIGVAGALAASRYLETMLFGVTPRDPVTLAAVVMLLAAVAMCAALVPSRRASRLDPAETLRCE